MGKLRIAMLHLAPRLDADTGAATMDWPSVSAHAKDANPMQCNRSFEGTAR